MQLDNHCGSPNQAANINFQVHLGKQKNCNYRYWLLYTVFYSNATKTKILNIFKALCTADFLSLTKIYNYIQPLSENIYNMTWCQLSYITHKLMILTKFLELRFTWIINTQHIYRVQQNNHYGNRTIYY